MPEERLIRIDGSMLTINYDLLEQHVRDARAVVQAEASRNHNHDTNCVLCEGSRAAPLVTVISLDDGRVSANDNYPLKTPVCFRCQHKLIANLAHGDHMTLWSIAVAANHNACQGGIVWSTTKVTPVDEEDDTFKWVGEGATGVIKRGDTPVTAVMYGNVNFGVHYIEVQYPAKLLPTLSKQLSPFIPRNTAQRVAPNPLDY